MSLKVWLPLLGNLENQGISNGKIENMGAVTANNSGKIGQCMSFTGTATSNIRLPPILKNTDDFSITFWVKFNTNVNQCLFSQRTAVTDAGFTIFYLNGTNMRLDEGKQLIATSVVTTNTWYHVACCRDSTKTYIYINGVLKASGTRSNTNASYVNSNYAFIGGSQQDAAGTPAQSNANMLNGYLNDYRIYDHCLSAAEVKEISQGLVLHYKLDSPANINNNLYVGSENFTGSSWGNLASWADTTETYQNFKIKHRSGTWSGLFQNVPCTIGDIFTISFYGKVDLGGRIQTIHRSNLGNVTTGLTILGGNFSGTSTNYWVDTTDDGTQWKRYWATLQVVSSDVTTLKWRLENSVSGKEFYICGIKLERGSAHTPWSPASSEAGETNIIQDSSGYGHNGTVTGNVQLASDSGRYSNCIYIPSGNTDYITTNDVVGDFSSGITMNIWFKSSCTTPGNDYHEIFNIATATQNFENAIHKTGYYRSGMHINGTRNVQNTAALSLVNGNWHMLTLTYDNNIVRRYVDGIERVNSTVAGTVTSTSCKFLLGHYGTNTSYYAKEAYLSDARIYTTALSADDIKQLYNTVAKVDNLGGLHTFEAIENLPNIIFKIDSARGAKVFQDGLSRYTQSQCQVTLTDEGYHIYRPPNLVYSSAGKVMWGGLKLVNQTSDTVSPYNASRDNVWGLQKTHTYLFAFHAKGQSSNSPSLNVQNNMGWDRIAGMGPNPTYISTSTIPANFNGEKDCYIIFTINDDIIKTATKTEGGYTTGEQYLSYRDLSLNYGYTDTGALGTDLYLIDFRLYDITNYIGQIKKTGITNFSDYVERNGILQIRNKAELLTSNLIEH